jgi:hypothetical protein
MELGSGQWVRTSNPRNAKAFMAEKRMMAERRQAAADRRRDRLDAVVDWVRTRLRRDR